MESRPRHLVAYDGSSQSKAALDWAISIGCKTGAEIVVTKVFEPIVRHYTRGDYNIAEQIVKQFTEMEQADNQMMKEVTASKSDDCNAKIQTKILKGPVVHTLLDYANQNGATMLIAGTKGHHLLESLLVGSVASSLVTLSKIPVMVVTDQRVVACPQKILVAYDGSEHAKGALIFAVGLAKRLGAEILVAKVLDPLDLAVIYSKIDPGSEVKVGTELGSELSKLDTEETAMMEEALAIARANDVKGTTAILTGGNIAATLIRYAEEQKAEIIVAGTLGRGLLRELMLGSVARTLVTLAQMPVLIVK